MSLNKKMDVADSSWVPLRAAVFDCFWKYELEGGAKQLLLPFKSPVAPKTVEIIPAKQMLKYVFADGSIFESAPWDFLSNEERLPQNAFAAALLHKAVRGIWDSMKDN